MSYTILVNRLDELTVRQTTTRLIQAAAQRTDAVWVVDVHSLSCGPSGDVSAWGRRAPQAPDTAVFLQRFGEQPSERVYLNTQDVLLIRTNPGRDLQHASIHRFALDVAQLLQEAGVLVLNAPQGLRRAASKLYLHTLPEAVRPKTLISRNPEEIRAFLEDLSGPVVLKPLQGSRGRDVFMVASPQDKNLYQIIDVLSRNGMPMVQAFVPEAVEGDTRVVLMDGRILEIDGHAAAVRRIPGGSDFRSNIHVGGHPERGVITPAMRELVAQVGPQLARDGLFLVGLDIIGSKVVEVNVFSTGGFYDAERYSGVSFTDVVWETIERKFLP